MAWSNAASGACGSWWATGARDSSPPSTPCLQKRDTGGAWCVSCATCPPRRRRPTGNGRPRRQGRVRYGIPEIRPGQGRGSRQGDGRQEAEGRGELPARGDRRDDDLPAARVSRGAPQAHPHEQQIERPNWEIRRRTRVAGSLPDGQRLHARLSAHQVRHRERMVDPPLPGHVPAR